MSDLAHLDPWYVLFRDSDDLKWAAATSRSQAIGAARRLLGEGVAVIEVGPLDPGSEGETLLAGDLQQA